MNTKTITEAGDTFDLGNNFSPTGITAALPQLITGGVRMKYHF